MIGVIDRDTCIRIGIRRNVGYRPLAAPTVCLPTGLGDISATTTSSATPGSLTPATRIACLGQCCAANGRHVLRCGRELHAVAAVTRACCDGNAWMIEMRLVVYLIAVLTAAIAITNFVCSLLGSLIDSRC